MGQSARVTSIETVERFRNALCEFGKDVQDSLGAAEMQIHRTFDWLAERLKYWQHQIRVREEELVRAKIELTSRKFANLRADPRVALLIGWEAEQTVQYEGIAELLSGDALNARKPDYFAAASANAGRTLPTSACARAGCVTAISAGPRQRSRN